MTHRDDNGNVQVDFVWGNFPMQPNDDRETNLDPTLDSHSIVYDGYSNFPGFIADYSGDEDSGLEAVIPNVVRLTRSAAEDLLATKNLEIFAVDHNLTVSYLESTGTTLRVTAYDTNWNNWGAGYTDGALIGLREGDQVNFSVNYDGDPLSLPSNSVVTAVNVDGDSSWFEIKTPTDLNLDGSADGTVYAGDNLINVVTMQRDNYAPGMIVDEYTGVHVRFIAD